MYQEDPNKEKRIAFLSIFSSICRTGQIDTKTAGEITDNLFKKYPLEEKTMPTYKATGYNSKPTAEGDTCACGLPREYREGIKDGKKWRAMFCKKKACKPIWLPNLKEMERAKAEDDMQDVANHQQFDEYGNPIG